MLFMPANERREPPRTLAPHVAAIGRLRDALREDGHRFGIYLLPDKLAVYRDLLKVPVPHGDEGRASSPGSSARSAAWGSPCDLEPVLHRAVGDAFRRGELIYWTDHTHWDPRGIDIAARELGRAFDLCGRPGPGPAPASRVCGRAPAGYPRRGRMSAIGTRVRRAMMTEQSTIGESPLLRRCRGGRCRARGAPGTPERPRLSREESRLERGSS